MLGTAELAATPSSCCSGKSCSITKKNTTLTSDTQKKKSKTCPRVPECHCPHISCLQGVIVLSGHEIIICCKYQGYVDCQLFYETEFAFSIDHPPDWAELIIER